MTPLAQARPAPALLTDLGGAQPTYRGALAGELLKLRRNRPTWVMTGLGVLFLGFMMLLYATEGEYQQYFSRDPLVGFYDMLHPLQLFLAGGGGVALLISGSRLFGMEFELGTLRVLLGRGTGRQQLLAAKLSALTVYALVLLVGFTVLAAIGAVLVVEHQVGSLAPLEGLPGSAWANLGGAVAACAISEFSCALLAIAMPALLRSVTGGMLLAVVFFPIDNGLAVALTSLGRLTHDHIWDSLTAFLYGPSLNRLPTVIQAHHVGVLNTLPTPAVTTSLPETCAVIGAWWLLLVLLAATSLARHDVLS
ncbi:MAG: ABC transporter permease [Candidatus Dormibacteria bacterium]